MFTRILLAATLLLSAAGHAFTGSESCSNCHQQEYEALVRESRRIAVSEPAE